MARMVVVRNKEGSVSCIPMANPLAHYQKKYDVVVIVNKPWNYHHVSKIKKYFGSL